MDDDWTILSEIPIQPSQSSGKCEPGWLAGRIELLLSAFRRDDYTDPIGFVRQLGMVLERYPPAVVAYVTDPMTGLQRQLKFAPSIAEVVEACEREAQRQERLRRYADMGHPHRASRSASTPEGQSYDEMFAKHGRPYGPFESGRQLPYKSP